MCSGDHKACVMDLSRGADGAKNPIFLERSPEKLAFGQIAFASSGELNYFPTISFDCWLRTWDLEKGKLLARTRLLDVEDAKVRLVSSPDGNLLGCVHVFDHALHIWRAPSWEEIEKTQTRERKNADGESSGR